MLERESLQGNVVDLPALLDEIAAVRAEFNRRHAVEDGTAWGKQTAVILAAQDAADLAFILELPDYTTRFLWVNADGRVVHDTRHPDAGSAFAAYSEQWRIDHDCE
jgi:hypothetical protein